MFDSKRITFRQVIEIFLKTYKRQQVFDSSIDNINVLRPTKSVNKCFDYARFVLVQNAAFNITNAGKNNAAFILVIGIVEYKMRVCSYF